MRPRLHPAMGNIPIAARVAVRLTERVWRNVEYCECSASECSLLALRKLPLDYPGFLRFALHSLHVYLSLGWRSSAWLEQVLDAAHYGHSFRRCFYFDYKENRRTYPRVTNRGVQTTFKGKNNPNRLGFDVE